MPQSRATPSSVGTSHSYNERTRGEWRQLSVFVSMSAGREGRKTAGAEEETDSKSVQTACAGTEPYYSVPILQKVLSPAPGYSSALYSVQVMTQSEVDSLKSQSSGYQRDGPSSCDKDKSRDVCPCDSTVQLPSTLDATNISESNENHSHSSDSKPVNLSFPK